jgi:large subunit ribosomal protein L7Ae
MASFGFEVPKDLNDKQLQLLEKASKNGKVKVGVNETTKMIERGTAKLVIVAKDVQPAEIVMHLPLLCREKNIPCSFIATKKELGEKAGLNVGTSAIAIVDEGEAKKELEEITKKLKELTK